MSFIPTAAIADKAAFTEGTTGIVPVGGEWNDSSPAVTAGQVAAFRITEKRAAHVNLRSETGTELGTSAAPVQVSIANTGANATAVKVDGSAVTQPVSGAVSVSNFPATQNTQDAADGAPASAVPAKAQQVGGSDGTNLRALAMDTTGRAKVLLYDPSGNALTVSGGKLLVTPDSVALPAHQSVNVDQWNGTAPDTNSGVKSAGTLRVVLATDQPALTNKLLVTPDSVALPLHQSVNLDQLSGTAPDTNSGAKSAGTLRVVLATDQPALTNALKVDGSAVTQPVSAVSLPLPAGASTSAKQPALGAAGTPSADVITVQGAPSMTAVKVDGSAVTQPVSGTVTANAGTGTMSTADASDMVGTSAGTAPADTSIVGSKYNTSAPAPTNAQCVPQQCDLAGNLKVVPGIATQTLAAWNSATALNATQTLISNHGAPALLLQLDQTTTLTAGQITIQVTYDGTNWVTPAVSSLIDTSLFQPLGNAYTVQASTNKSFLLVMNGAQQARIVLSVVITGTGSVTPFVTYLACVPGLLTVASAQVGNNGSTYPHWIGSNQVNTAVTAVSTTLFTAAAGYFVTSIFCSFDPKSTQTTAGTVAVQFQDSVAGTFWSFYVFIPATAPTLTVPTIVQVQTPAGFIWNNKNSGSSLKVLLGSALTAGNMAFTLNYGATSIIG